MVSLAGRQPAVAYWLLQRSGAQLLVGQSSAAARPCVGTFCACSWVVLWFYYAKSVNVNWSKCSMAEALGPLKNSSGTHEISTSPYWVVQLSFFYTLSLSIIGFLYSFKFTGIVLLVRDMKKSSCWSVGLFWQDQGYRCDYCPKVILPEHCFPLGNWVKLKCSLRLSRWWK